MFHNNFRAIFYIIQLKLADFIVLLSINFSQNQNDIIVNKFDTKSNLYLTSLLVMTALLTNYRRLLNY